MSKSEILHQLETVRALPLEQRNEVLAELFMRYKEVIDDQIKKHCWRLRKGNSRSDTDEKNLENDLTSKFYMKFPRVILRYKGTGELNAYLGKTIYNMITDMLRKSQKQIKQVVGVDDEGRLHTQDELTLGQYIRSPLSPWGKLVIDEVIKDLADHDGIKPREHEAVLLSIRDELKQKEIADQYGVSVKSIQRWEKKWKKEFRRILERKYDVSCSDDLQD